ncbi:DEAD/DEAH box helicase family protein [Bacillus sp. MCCB 382]|uniref:DEAD/DEAH box helicase n=1 Tax=Bacillus sp. MCCB 382 TaxID=2860197 RepID=UPI001C596299|nr:DEAD/DEAH box helicase family protein [Bacillus sp. MCCB 382]
MGKELNSKKWNDKIKIQNILYDFQIDALNLATRYLNSPTTDHALIKMPTGTGKTVLIGLLSHFYSGVKNILIITPSRAVKKHLLFEIEKNIIEKFNLTNLNIKGVKELLPSKFESSLQNDPSVYISTVKGLSDIKSNKKDYQKLKGKIDLIIFDEGHREPAEEWQLAIRNLEKKVILFTATPIRNDNKKFKFNKDFVFNFPFELAVENNYVRNVKFNLLESKDVKSFMEEIITKFEKFEDEYKIILRFNNTEEIGQALQVLRNSGKRAIAIHDTFNSADTYSDMVKNVPSDIKSKAVSYWLHQNKMLEGLDDNKFVAVAIYGTFTDVRSLVQQVGRIIRHSNFGKDSIYQEFGEVYYKNSEQDQEKLWEEYIFYEKKLFLNKDLIFFNFEDYMQKIINGHPDILHNEKRFLKKIQHRSKKEDILYKYKLPLRTNIYFYNQNYDFDEIVKKVEEFFALEDYYIISKVIEEKESFFFAFYTSYKNSPYLVNESFLEVKTGILLLKVINDILFVFDSNNIIPNFIKDNFNTLESTQLQKLFNEKSKFSQISITNGSISKNEVNRSVFFADNLKNTAPQVTDKYRFATTANGTIINMEDKVSKRYIGFRNSKVSDSSYEYSLSNYLKWLNFLEEKLTKKPSNTENIFSRYAPITKKPKDIKPIWIQFNIKNLLNDSKPIELIKSAYGVNTEGGKWVVTLEFYDGFEKKLQVLFDPQKNRYYFAQLDKMKISIDKEGNSITDYLNRKQAFQVVTNSPGYIYSHNFFFKVGIDKEKKELLPILKEFKLQEDILLTEKGPLVSREEIRDDWDENSLFHLISNQGSILDSTDDQSKVIQKELEDLDYIICSDLGNEIADFIGIKDSENKRKVYFIHCKATKEKKKLSASSFQEICGQIIKNLDYVHPLSIENPGIENWNSEWIGAKYKVKKLRMIKNKEKKTPEELWELIKDIKKDQEGEVYVWALIGNMFSLSKYRSITNHHTNKQYIPFHYILNNTWAAVQSAGAKFKVLFNRID